MAFLPPNLKMMFNPRPPPPFLEPPPPSNLPAYSGLMSYLNEFTDPSKEEPFKKEHIETLEEKREKKRKLKISENEEKVSKALKAWDPYSNTEATGDPYKTIFVSRISYQTTQQKLEYEFNVFGQVKSIFLVKDKSNPEKHRGYAFIEFERERDMKAAYKQADGMKIDDRRIVVDIERGRVIKNWKPRKFGGGLGNTRAGGADVNQTFSGRELSESREKEKEREKEREKEKERLERIKKREGSSGGSGSGSGGDRSSRSDRDRSDRDRSDRSDRDRSDRDRSDRDRSDRDRSDRDRDRDRDRDYRSSDRDRDRDRSDRDRSDRDRDRSDRDRSDRDRRDRDRSDRDRSDRDRSDRDRSDRDRSDRDRSDRDRGDRRERERDHRGGGGGGGGGDYNDRRREPYGLVNEQHFENFQYQPIPPPPHHVHLSQPHPERVNRDYSMISNENGY